MHNDNLIGREFGGYIVQERIARGVSSYVYRAFDPTLRREAAIKIFRLNALTHTPQYIERFQLETQLVASLKHMHILSVYDYGVEEDVAYLVMPLLRGGTLENLLSTTRILPLDQTTRLITQIARAVEYAAKYDLVHRDLQPNNVLLDKDGNAFMSDFGLAQRLTRQDPVSSRETTLRDPAYVPPEQIRGEPIDIRSNVYSLGMMMYRMSTGRLPFEGRTADYFTRMQQYLTQPLPSPQLLNSDIPATLADVILRALDKDPERRYQTIDDFMNALNAALGNLFEGIDVETLRAGALAQDAQRQAVADATRTNTRRALPIIIGTLIVSVVLLVVLYQFSPVPSYRLESQLTQAAGQILPTAENIRNAQRNIAENGGFVAYIACDTRHPADAARIEVLEARSQSYSIPMRIYDSRNSLSVEISAVQRAVQDGARVIMHCTRDEFSAIDTLRSAREQGIPLVLDSDKYLNVLNGAFIQQDDGAWGYTLGIMAGAYIEENLQERIPRVVILNYSRIAGTPERIEGIEAGLTTFAPNARIIGRYQGHTVERAERAIEQLIRNNTAFDIVLAVNADGAVGAMYALSAANIPASDVAVFTIGGDTFTVDNLPYLRQAVLTPDTERAQALFDLAVRYLGGGQVPGQVSLSAPVVYPSELSADGS